MIASGAVNPNDSLPGNPNQTYAQALGVVDYANPAMQGVANLAMMAMPAPMKLGINFAKSMNDGSSFGDALTQAAKDFVTGKAIGAVNQSVGQALGPDTAKVLGDYNKYASYADAFGAKVPTVSAGGIIANQLGLGTSGMTGTNASMTDGSTPNIPVSGWSSGNGQTSQAPMVAPATPTAAPTQITSTPVNASLGDMTAAFNSGYKSHQSHNGA
jgi:hypothetical protein